MLRDRRISSDTDAHTLSLMCVFMLLFAAVGRHLTGLSTLLRGKDVRHKLLHMMGHMEYPLERGLLPGADYEAVKPGRSGRSYSMKCLTFTNTDSKTNPGDRVDMDVSHVRLIASTA